MYFADLKCFRHVSSLRSTLKVLHIDTRLIAAHVMDDCAVRDRTLGLFPRPPVRSIPDPLRSEIPVAQRMPTTNPHNTVAFTARVRPKPFRVSQAGPGISYAGQTLALIVHGAQPLTMYGLTALIQLARIHVSPNCLVLTQRRRDP